MNDVTDGMFLVFSLRARVRTTVRRVQTVSRYVIATDPAFEWERVATIHTPTPTTLQVANNRATPSSTAVPTHAT